MKNLLKVLGPIIVLIGVVFLVLYYLGYQSNNILAAGGITMVVGLLVYLFFNKRIKE